MGAGGPLGLRGHPLKKTSRPSFPSGWSFTSGWPPSSWAAGAGSTGSSTSQPATTCVEEAGQGRTRISAPHRAG